MMSTPSDMIPFSMENIWTYRWYFPQGEFDNEQEFVDYMFIWIIYAEYGVLLSMENLHYHSLEA